MPRKPKPSRRSRTRPTRAADGSPSPREPSPREPSPREPSPPATEPPELPHPHDALFKRTFQDADTVRAELRAILPPELLRHLDLALLEPTPTTFITKKLRSHFSDRLFKTKLAGRDARIYLLFEHKSTRDKWALVQMLVYVAQIYSGQCRQQHPPERLPPVVPVLFSHAPEGWKASVGFHDLLDPIVRELPELARLVPSFTVLLDDLAPLDDAAIARRQLGLLGELVFLLLRDARTHRFDQTVVKLTPRLLALAQQDQDAYLTLFCYIREVSHDYRELVRSNPELQTTMRSISEIIEERAEERGVRIGEKRGVRIGRIETLCEVHGVPVTKPRRQLLATADATTLDRIVAHLRTHHTWPDQ